MKATSDEVLFLFSSGFAVGFIVAAVLALLVIGSVLVKEHRK